MLAYTLSDNSWFYYDEQGNWNGHGWKILFELLIIVFALYFFFKEVILEKGQTAQQGELPFITVVPHY